MENSTESISDEIIHQIHQNQTDTTTTTMTMTTTNLSKN